MGDLTIRDAEARDAHAIAKIQVNASRVVYAGIFSTVSSTMTIESRIPVWQDFIAVAGGPHRLLVAEICRDLGILSFWADARPRPKRIACSRALLHLRHARALAPWHR